ncbi:hypothetical protein C922_03197 [Plasmodium inui San Antonio 1]|uniref:Uncharacterized protein n=1 Tax=Plasmodium inui San Antonio 1 TaxID=1237626 RepID=W7ALS9_9APIC|nr:hypothetical protein C922_03197 [Plasmodium inui San Antonio 1]EUD66281.1 hypothetical protein C922_03197 [Plasmodium inui San Antonio 1]
MNTFSHMVKIALFTLFIYISGNNGISEYHFGRGFGKGNIRCLTQMNREFGRPEFSAQGERSQFVNGENTTEKKDGNREGSDSQNGPWNNYYQGPYGSDPQMHGGVYRNGGAPEYYNNNDNIRYVSPRNNFNKELSEKLKSNAIIIIPAMLIGLYFLRNTNPQTLIMLAAIAGILMYTNHYIS